MAKVEVEGKFPKRIDDFVLYKLNDQVIIRAISGFTTKALKSSPKYALSRQNASEFGRVSSTSKQLRVALAPFLPKKNNLAVVNTLNKKMRALLPFDMESGRGERTLAKAMATAEAQQQMKGYHFNPEASSAPSCTLDGDQLQLFTAGIVVPEGANSVGIAVVALAFDYESLASSIAESEKHFFAANSLPDPLVLVVPTLEYMGGVVFTVLVIEFYSQDDTSFVPMKDDRSKVVMVVEVKS